MALAAIALVLVALPAAAEEAVPLDPCVEAAATAVQRRYETVRDLRADFVQRSQAVALGPGGAGQSEASGRVVIAKPGKMRWIYEKPEPSLVVSDGTTLWIYDPAFREAQKLPVTGEYLSGATVQFLLGAGRMQRDFRVTAVSCSERQAVLELIPREDATYERLRIRTNPASGDIEQTTIVDLLGNVTEVEFSNLEVNQDPDPGLFEFEPGADVRVIELAPEQP